MAAKEGTLGTVQEKLADHFLEMLEKGTKADGEPLTASDLNVIRQFLKDNGIEAVPEKSKGLNAITDKLDATEGGAVLPFPRADSD